MSDVVISARGLGKRYLIGHKTRAPSQSFRERIMAGAGGLVRNLAKAARGKQLVQGEVEEFWALKDVDFDIHRGETVGIVGRNGAGKSTLLKILSRITEPTTGRVEISGRVASLLEVGTGFHAELTGRENIFLNGAILGMSRAEILRKFDEIVEFAGVEKFLDTPVKRYSSGMNVRLAFSVAAHLEPEILVVDEVLAVGDVEFQNKCLGKVKDVAQRGRTVLFVSHNMGAVSQLCTQGIVLENGGIALKGDVDLAVAGYFAQSEPEGRTTSRHWRGVLRSDPSLQLCFTNVEGEDNPGPTFSPNEPIRITVIYDQKVKLRAVRVVLRVLTINGEIAFASTDESLRIGLMEAGRYRVICTIPPGLFNRRHYIVQLNIFVLGLGDAVPLTEIARFNIDGVGNDGSAEGIVDWPGVICPRLDWNIERTHDNDVDA